MNIFPSRFSFVFFVDASDFAKSLHIQTRTRVSCENKSFEFVLHVTCNHGHTVSW